MLKSRTLKIVGEEMKQSKCVLNPEGRPSKPKMKSFKTVIELKDFTFVIL